MNLLASCSLLQAPHSSPLGDSLNSHLRSRFPQLPLQMHCHQLTRGKYIIELIETASLEPREQCVGMARFEEDEQIWYWWNFSTCLVLSLSFMRLGKEHVKNCIIGRFYTKECIIMDYALFRYGYLAKRRPKRHYVCRRVIFRCASSKAYNRSYFV